MTASATNANLYLFSATRQRALSKLIESPLPAGPNPSIAEIAQLASAGDAAWAWTIAGGEPTLRADLPQLIEALALAKAPRLGLHSDGLALNKPAPLRVLKSAGLVRLCVPLHSGRSDAHDWLVNTPGAARRARKAIHTAAALGIEVEAEIALTRSTASHLEETVQLLSVLGARSVRFRRPNLTQLGVHAVSLSPRFGLLQPYLTAAIHRARNLGLGVQLEGLPHCASPEGFRSAGLQRPIRWRVPASTEWRPQGFVADTQRCPGCPADCIGAPVDYTALFAHAEFVSQANSEEPLNVLDDSAMVPVPAPRNGWQPATRVAVATKRARFGRPEQAPVPMGVRRTLTLPLAADDTARYARAALVRAAQDRPDVLHLTGHWLTHAQGLKLLAETRFFLGDVHLTGLIHPLGPLNDRALGRLERLKRVRAVLLGPDALTHDARAQSEGAFDHTLALLDRLSALDVDAQLVVFGTDEATTAAYAKAVRTGGLPSLPHFLPTP